MSSLRPVQRHTVADDVFDQLMTEVSGLSPGASLPSERRLAEVLGVSRPVVREALRRLDHAGLVDVRQGDATTVRDFRRLGGLDLLARLLAPGGEIDPTVARSILQARHAIGPVVAGMAAERADRAPMVSRLHDLAGALRATTDAVTRQRLALEFWDAVVDAADSIVFRLMFNSLRAAYEPMLDALAAVMAEEVDQAGRYAGLADAISSGDPDTARARAEDLLGPVTRSLIATLDRLESADPDSSGTKEDR